MNSGSSGDDQSTVQASETEAHQRSSATPSPFNQATNGSPPPQIPDHQLLRCIGRGAYGEVWLARNVLGQFRAVKLVYRNKFEHDRPYEREFEGIRKFEPISRGHESQVDILHVGRDDQAGYFYYVMELADDAGPDQPPATADPALRVPAGRTLASSVAAPSVLVPETYRPHTLKLDLHRQARLPPERCIEIGLALSTALQHLHENGLLHRDIKPSNVIFTRGVPKLGDIGLVASMDATMSFVGTPGFLPPEGPGTPQGDIYSLGKVLYEMCMGRDRHEFPKLPANLAEFEDSPRLLELNAIILKACHLDPSERYASAEAMGADLALLKRGESVKHRRRVHRRWMLTKQLGVAACIAALLIYALSFLRSPKRYTPTPEVARLYEMAKWHYNQLTPFHHMQASTNLAEVLQRDPKFIAPYAELVALYIWDEIGIDTERERLEKVKAITDKLALIAPGSAEFYEGSSFCRFLQRDWVGAQEEILKSIKINPNLAITRHFYSFYLTMLGRFKEAHLQAQRAMELEPSSRASAIIAAWPFMGERRYDRAIEQLQGVLTLDKNFSAGHNFLGICYEAQSNYVAALEEYKLASLMQDGAAFKTAACYDAVRQAYDAGGQDGYLQKVIEIVLDDRIPSDEKCFGEADLAGYYARLGENQKALDLIEKHFDRPGVWHRLTFEPLYENLRAEPRFKALLKRAGLEP